MTKDVFISYTTVDKAKADQLVEYLEENCISCFIAPRDIDPGKAYASHLMHAISNCSLFLLICSDAINNSEHVLNEVDAIFEKKKAILPVFIEDFELNDDFRYYLGRKQRILAYPNEFESYFPKVLESALEICPVKQKAGIDFSMPSDIAIEETQNKKTVFEYIPERGIMINPEDHQRNVSFRNDTLINMMGGIFEKVAEIADEETSERIFYASGYSGGKNFAERINNQWDTGYSLTKIRDKFDKWCQFDSNVGWGKFSAEILYDESNDMLTGTLTISEAFIVDRVKKRKICGFIRGYCTGVIETLLVADDIHLDCKECPLHSKFNCNCVFTFQLKG